MEGQSIALDYLRFVTELKLTLQSDPRRGVGYFSSEGGADLETASLIGR